MRLFTPHVAAFWWSLSQDVLSAVSGDASVMEQQKTNLRARDSRPIVIAEEYADDADLIARKLRSANVQRPIFVSYDSDDVIEYFTYRMANRSALPCALFTNLTLMSGNAGELVSWMRRQPLLRDVKVIVFNDAKNAADRESMAGLSVDALWEKFPSVQQLASIMQSV